MKEKIILTDIDGVCVDWDRGFTKFAKKYFDMEINDSTESHARQRWVEMGRDIDDLIWHFNMSAWIKHLEPFRDAQTVIPQLSQEGWKFVAITSMHEDEHAHKLREENLQTLFGDAFTEVICIGTGYSKDDTLKPYKDSGYLWIEDKWRNAVLGADMGLDTILIKHPYNAYKDDSRITKVENWQQIYHYINKQ